MPPSLTVKMAVVETIHALTEERAARHVTSSESVSLVTADHEQQGNFVKRVKNTCSIRQLYREIFAYIFSISSPKSTFLLVTTKNTECSHFQDRKSIHSEIETTVVANGYKSGHSIRLRINWKSPESEFLTLTKRKADSGDEIEFFLPFLTNHARKKH